LEQFGKLRRKLINDSYHQLKFLDSYCKNNKFLEGISIKDILKIPVRQRATTPVKRARSKPSAKERVQ